MNASPAPWSFTEWGDDTVAGPARDVAGDVDASFGLARHLEGVARSVGRRTWSTFSALATLGSVDLTTARTVEPHWDATRSRPPDQVALVHLGTCDAALHATLLTLRDAARAVDTGRADGEAGRVLAARVRAQVARCAEEVLTTVGHALGPGPLALDPVHAARVADLTLYLRQHHAERDLAVLGRLVTTAPEHPSGHAS